jgi:hypothetical protein
MTQYPTLTAFMKQFHDTESCHDYLSKENGRVDSYAGNAVIRPRSGAKNALHRRCQKCLYYEYPAAHTIFHKLKFPIEHAFAMVYLLSTTRKGVSSFELARQFGIHQETAWFFKRKVQRTLNRFPEAKL